MLVRIQPYMRFYAEKNSTTGVTNSVLERNSSCQKMYALP